MGRSPHQPDPSLQRQVEAMAAYGIPEFDIARVLKVDPKTLRKYYQEELELGHTKANAQVAGFLFNSAKNGKSSGSRPARSGKSQPHNINMSLPWRLSISRPFQMRIWSISKHHLTRSRRATTKSWQPSRRRLRLSRPLRFQAPDALGGIIGSSCRRPMALH